MQIQDMLKIASKFAVSGDAHRETNLSAIGIRKDGTVVFSRNGASRMRMPSAHAEARLCNKLGKYASLVIVVRIYRNGTFALSKPCPRCETLLRQAKVKKVFYTDPSGLIELEWKK